ncbi:lysosomal acid phosphatase [Diabrotica virgifera virgifera]|uniref:acid phosphatase n=1 Tax=Diabrotica virgifera virgifera TaxID=50390 RepID=A0ABM5IYI7_DIAVI|nr:lysosomal acid phosphatase [Diabrotica virgifera virgifera]
MTIPTNIILLLCLIFAVIENDAVNDCNSELVALVQIFRHGERSPITFYSTDPYANAAYWEDLGGELTNRGKRQHEALGQHTRNVYSDFLPTRFNSNVLYATTTDVHRTHMSGQCNLYGMFPAVGNNIWKENLNWQPIPLHQADPYIFNGNPVDCPNYDLVYADLWLRKPYAALLNKYQSVFEYLTEHTGDNVTDFLSALTVHDCLLIEDGVGYELPEWASEVYPEPLATIAGIGYKSLTDTLELQQFYCGTLVNDIVEYLDAKISNPLDVEQYRIYSGHDSNIAALLNTFGAFDEPYSPAFASTIYIELRQRESDDLFVNVYSKNNDDIKKISVRNCASDCPFAQFKEQLSNVVLDVGTFKEMCKVSDTNIVITEQHKKIIDSYRKIKKLFS